jgi:hypothetical protein
LSTNWLAIDLHAKIESFKNLDANKTSFIYTKHATLLFLHSTKKKEKKRSKTMT